MTWISVWTAAMEHNPTRYNTISHTAQWVRIPALPLTDICDTEQGTSEIEASIFTSVN